MGLAVILEQGNMLCDLAGSEPYLAPEVMQEKPYNEKADIWSFGMTLRELLGEEDPYDDCFTPRSKMRRIQRGVLRPKYIWKHSLDLSTFLDSCLSIHPGPPFFQLSFELVHFALFNI